MPEFKIKCEYYQIEKRKFFKGEKGKDYHRFLVKNPKTIPEEYCSRWKEKFAENQVNSWIFIEARLLKKLDISNFFKEEERKKQYRFILKLGEEKAAKFMKKNPNLCDNYPWHNNMVLKTSEYFQNTVQKIGYWESDNYFYEADKKENSPPKPNQPTNKNIWIKITLICLLFLIPALMFLWLIKWMSKKTKN